MPESEAVLRLSALRLACERLIDFAEQQFGPEIDLAARGLGSYWNVDVRAAYLYVDDPNNALDVGALWDDVESTEQLLRRPDGDVYLWHDLQHVTGLLRAVAYLDLPG